MPSTTPKQARTMAAAAHDPTFAKRVGIPQRVATDFNQADTGTRMLSRAMRNRHAEGGSTSDDATAKEQLQALLDRITPSVYQSVMGHMGSMGGGAQEWQMPQMPYPRYAQRPVQMPSMQPHPMGMSPFSQGSPPSGASRGFARGGMLAPPGPGQFNIGPPKPSPLATLIGNKFAAQHAGYPGPRKPRIPLPGALRNINQRMGLGIGSGHGRGRIAEGGRIGFARGGESGALERLLEFVHEAVIAHDDPRVLSGQIREPIHRLTSFPEDLAKQQLGDVYKHYGLPYDPKGFSFLPDPPKLNYVEQRPQSVDDSVLTNPNTYGWYLMKMRGPESQVKPLLDKVKELGGNMSPEIYDQADFRYPSKEEHFRGGKV